MAFRSLNKPYLRETLVSLGVYDRGDPALYALDGETLAAKVGVEAAQRSMTLEELVTAQLASTVPERG